MDILWSARGEQHVPRDGDWLTDAEQARAAAMRFTKRRTEFFVSRWTAKDAVARVLGWEPGTPATARRIEIRHRPTGAPVAFVDGAEWTRRVSLTDRAGWAVCAVGDGPVEVGCDLEVVEGRSDAFVTHYLTEDEQRAVVAAGELRDEMANLLWSAKESVLKVLGVGLRRDTRSVEVTVRPPAAPGAWGRFSAVVDGGARFPGHWRRFGGFVVTFAAATEIGSAVAMVDAATLEGARPVHSWMGRPPAGPGT
jgi:4'-phosphopantetheinyl transferase